MTMLQLSRLTKRYGKATALDDISLTLAAGERVALLGHNGAGKTTLMKLVLGLIAPDGGEIAVAGQVPGSQAARALTAYLPENAAFHPALSGREQIRHFLRLRGALASDIAHEIGRAAHELKGLAATVGAGRLAQMARSVDDVAQGMAAPALAVIVVPLRAEVDAVIACLDDAIADTSRR